MGQMTYALMIGVEERAVSSAGIDVEGLIKRYARSWKLQRYHERVPQVNYGVDSPIVLGFYIAVGKNAGINVPPLVGFELVSFPGAYGKAAYRAHMHWQKFADWAERRDVVLPKPGIWLVETEVA